MDGRAQGNRVMAVSSVTLRPMLPADVPALAALFRASVLELTGDDYGEDQRDAWAATAEEAAFGRKLAAQLTLVASLDGTTAGFASLEGKGKSAMLYVAPECALRGVATTLIDALVKLATARGAGVLTVDASDTARDVFVKHGFIPMVRNMVPVGAEWLGNTTMERKLAAAEQDT